MAEIMRKQIDVGKVKALVIIHDDAYRDCTPEEINMRRANLDRVVWGIIRGFELRLLAGEQSAWDLIEEYEARVAAGDKSAEGSLRLMQDIAAAVRRNRGEAPC